MLTSIQDYLNELIGPESLSVAAAQSANNQAIMRLLLNQQVQSVRMIEYDSESVKALIFFFLDKGASVHCLLQHPDSAVNESQRRRLIFQIVTKHEEYAGYEDRITFSYYRDTASVRGRTVDDTLISLGWYTYDRRPGIAGRQVWGHNNPAVLTDQKSAEGRLLVQFYDSLFENLLANSEPWEEVVSRYELYIRSSGASGSARRLLRFEVELSRVDDRYQLPNGVTLATSGSGDLATISRAELLPVLSSAFDDRRWDVAAISEGVLDPATCRMAICARSSADDRLVGFVSVHSTGDQEVAKLHWLAVDTGWRGQGIGNALVRAACGFAISHGYARMTLRTEDFRVAAIALYRGLGFREVSEDG
ncbi:GNAT family N-acetyltransferase [Nocardia amikacinitolerans]|uniref:GNAT family N-acetyltransferase n=1 Tax=Nocardia amikacinitolerans TaxID=756689 RepID=UPI0020A2A263|nr:GNAT family N-acetyltransferase [Nocardia amikacinitolerans]MCP2292823.1 Ribosomal protein S18 acetylase RimI [Nocardia amikacinitolerans]